ncbi:MAG: right-handed parallel beta-helix repeat-containing protein [Candidatus Limnocylindrales bacterium]
MGDRRRDPLHRLGSRSVGLAGAVLLVALGLSAATNPKAVPDPGPPADPWSVPFLSRPASGAIRLVGCRDVVIENRSFKDLGPNVEAIHLEGCENVIIRDNDFARVAQAITAVDSRNIRVEWNRYEDIVGPHARDGGHRANFVQFDKVRGGRIANNKGRGGDTEDILSIYASGGTLDRPMLIEDNHFEGLDWTSESGSGIALGDGGSDHTIARRNILLNPGQAGIFIAGGTNNAIIDNTVYGEQRPASNIGVYVWNQSESPCADNEVRGNRVRWSREDGEPNSAWDQGNCGPVVGWSTNDWDAVLDPASMRVEL